MSALHFNENSGRSQARTKGGTLKHDIRYPKYKQGGFVVRKVLEDATFGEAVFLVTCYKK